MSTPTTSKLILCENFYEQIECFQLSEYDWSSNLIGVCVSEKIILGLLKVGDGNQLEFLKLKEIQHDKVSNHIAFAPSTTLATLPATVVFAVSSVHFDLRVYKSNLELNNTVQIVPGHTNYINEISWQSEEEYLATVSDDHSCIIWDCNNDYEKKAIFHLTSAGISIKWHPDNRDKVLVGEKNGLIRYYNVKSEQAILSLESKKAPLMSIDWALTNNKLIAALAAGEVTVWNMLKATIPLHTKQVHENGGMIVKFSPVNENIIASIGGPNMTLKVYCHKTNTTILETPLRLYSGMCWHYNLPILVASQDRKLQFWSLT